MMADPALHHRTTAQDPDAITSSHATSSLSHFSKFPRAGVDGDIGSSTVVGNSHKEGSTFVQNSLPLRQATRQAAAPPKIHDITEKFTRACSGK